MAFTLATLKSTIQTYLKDSDTEFVADLDTIIKQAEDRILKTVRPRRERLGITQSLTTILLFLGRPRMLITPQRSITSTAQHPSLMRERAGLALMLNMLCYMHA